MQRQVAWLAHLLQHGDFAVYETSAIVNYVEETFDNVALRPKSPRERARMDQWISAVNSYYYPYMIYHVSHERRVFPELGIASDEKVVAHALPKIDVGLQAIEHEVGDGRDYLLGSELTVADFYLLPSTYAFGLTEEGKRMYPKYPAFCAGGSGWRPCRLCDASVLRCRRTLPSSMRGNGRFRIAQSTNRARNAHEVRSGLKQTKRNR